MYNKIEKLSLFYEAYIEIHIGTVRERKVSLNNVDIKS